MLDVGSEICKIRLVNTTSIKTFCNLMSQFESDLSLCYGRFIVDAKSIMGVLSLDGSKDLSLKILEKADGEFNEIKSLMENHGFICE